MAEGRGDVIRRKLGSAKAETRAEDAAPGPEKAWRLALARAARDTVKLALDVERLSLDPMSLAEILEVAPERGLIAVLEGPSRSLGVIMLAPDVLAGMIEAQTTGIVTASPASQRRPTRTDAAMAAGLIDGALTELERGLKGIGDAAWALGYRYASFLEDIRPLGLLLEEVPYKLMRAEVSLAFGAKKGTVFMALPADVRAANTVPADERRRVAETADFSARLEEHVMGAASQLDGVLARVSLTLAQVMDFELGQVVPLGAATLERISLEGMDGSALWEGRLGQNRGLRAVRLTEQLGLTMPVVSGAAPQAAQASYPDQDLMLRATGTD